MHPEHCLEHTDFSQDLVRLVGFSFTYKRWNIKRLFEEIKKKKREKRKTIPERSRLGYWTVC